MVARTLTAESTHEQGKAGPHRLHARGVRAHPAAQRRLQRASSASRSSSRCAARAAPAWRKRRDHRHLRAAAGQPPGLRARRVPAQHPPHRRDALERQVRRTARSSATCLGLGRAARHAQRPGLQGARPAHRHLPDRRAPRLRARPRRTGCATAASTRSSIDAVGNVVGIYHGNDCADAPSAC